MKYYFSNKKKYGLQGHPADVAEMLSKLNDNEVNISFHRLKNKDKIEVFSYLDHTTQLKIAKSLTDKDLSNVLNNLDPDDRTALFENIPDELIKHCLRLLNKDERKIALELIGYEEDSIGRLMTPNYIQVKEKDNINDVLYNIKKYGEKVETLDYIFVVDNNLKLIDDIKIRDILLSHENTCVTNLMDGNFIYLSTNTKIEEAFEVFEKYNRSTIPVITDNGLLVGVVTVDDIIDKIKIRDTEDIQKFGGLEELNLSYTKAPLAELIKKRAGWLIILFIGEMFTASAMSYYDKQIEKAVILALFVPLIISSGGNSGSQAASIIIRSLALGELKLNDWLYVLKKELYSGVILGSILGCIGFIRILIWNFSGLYNYGKYWIEIGLTVSLSLIIIVLWGTLSGSLIPFILRKIGFDPATASSPFVATMVDVSGLIIYFSIASIILNGKLL